MAGTCRSAAHRSDRIRCPRLSCLTGVLMNASRPRISENNSMFSRNRSGGILYMYRISLNDSEIGMSHQSWVLCPNTTPILPVFSILFS